MKCWIIYLNALPFNFDSLRYIRYIGYILYTATVVVIIAIVGIICDADDEFQTTSTEWNASLHYEGIPTPIFYGPKRDQIQCGRHARFKEHKVCVCVWHFGCGTQFTQYDGIAGKMVCTAAFCFLFLSVFAPMKWNAFNIYYLLFAKWFDFSPNTRSVHSHIRLTHEPHS